MKMIVFTDGASRGNPGPGGWGTIVIGEDGITESGGREDNTTNNRMELRAAIEALSQIPNDSIVEIYTDSSYLINGITKWVFLWKRNGWMTKTKEDVVNRDLWERLSEVKEGKEVEWIYIGGHSGIVGNERCDVIATSFADKKETELFNGPKEEYPLKNILDLSHSEVKVSKKSHSKAKAFSYVSMVDHEIKTHKTWAECEARVKGKTKARFRKALSEDDEKKIIEEFKKY
jgi:ribonuclease HI